MPQTVRLRYKPSPWQAASQLPIAAATPAARRPLGPVAFVAATTLRSIESHPFRQPVIKPQLRGVHLKRQVLVGSLIDDEMPTRPHKPPALFEAGIAGMRDVLKDRVGEHCIH